MSARLGAALLAAVALQACAGQGGATPAGAAVPLAKADWQVARAWCPVGCSAGTLDTLKAQVGQPVRLSQDALAASFIDPCDGRVHLRLAPTPVAQIVASVNVGLPPGHRRLNAADLGTTGAPLSGWALCKGAAADLNLQRLLVVAPDRVLLLGEEQSLIELR